MGVKLITEKDFWMCTEGAVPAPLQGTHLSLKKKNGDSVFITVADKATASWIDFGCKKYMVLVAIAVALVAVALVVAGVITVATGGLGLFAIGAIAGVVGGVIGAVVGGLLCGQKMVSKREWLTQGKANFISQGANTITSEHKMICPIGGEIAFAPHVKSWLDAILMAGASYASSLIECAMTGGMIGSMGGALMGSGGLLASAKTVFGQGWKAVGKSVLGFLKNTPKVVLNNLIKKDTSEIVATASQSLLGSYGKDGKLTSDSVLDATHEVFLSDVESVKNILTGNGSPSDIISVAALMIPGDSNGKKTKNTDSVGNSKTESGGGHRHSETMDSSHTEKSTSTSATSPEATNVSQHKVDQGGNVSNLNKSETSDMHTNSGDSSHGTNSSDASTISDGETNVNQHKTKEEPSNVAEDKSPSEETTSKEHQIDEQEAKGNEEAKDDIDKQKEETGNDSAEDTKSKTHADSNDGKKTIGEEAEAYSEGGDKHIVTPKTSVTPDPPFKKSPKHSSKELSEEFNRQLKAQQDAINKMKVKEWLENRENFKNRNKADYSKSAKEARNNYRQQEIARRIEDNIINKGMNPQDAEKAALRSMKGQAALHNPDGVAGGKVDQITDMGDSRVNSSIGSQWKNGRAESIERQIKQSYGIPPKTIADIPDDAIMNVDLFKL
ncbi:polymorphic toxin type 15 domain-containing protein [Prevotella intermedia]|nr:polymorphic toxin type 15 domain-containing protein [Prevotella intermedia]